MLLFCCKICVFPFFSLCVCESKPNIRWLSKAKHFPHFSPSTAGENEVLRQLQHEHAGDLADRHHEGGAGHAERWRPRWRSLWRLHTHSAAVATLSLALCSWAWALSRLICAGRSLHSSQAPEYVLQQVRPFVATINTLHAKLGNASAPTLLLQ